MSDDWKTRKETCAAPGCSEVGTSHYCEEHYEARCELHKGDDRDDLLRLGFTKELWKLHTESGRVNMIDSLYEYERLVKERLERERMR